MYVYVGIFFFSAALAILARARGQSRALALVFGIFLVLFAGTRVDVGCDYQTYVDRFTSGFQGVSYLEGFRIGEGGFHLINFLVRDAGYSFAVVLFICGVLYVAGLSRFAILAQRPLSFLVLSFPILVIQLGMSGLRQALATGFLMLALKAFVDKRRALVVVWILVASQFHTSAIIFLPIVFLVGRQVSAWRLALALILIGPVVMLLMQDRMDVYTERYVEGESFAGGALFRYLLALIPFLLYQWKSRQIAERYPQLVELFRLFSFITIGLLVAGLVSTVVLHRLTFYVMPVSILALLCVADSIFDRRSERVGAAIPFLMYGAYIVVWFSTSRHAQGCYVPYQSWML